MDYYDDDDFYREMFIKLANVVAESGKLTPEERDELIQEQVEDGGPGVPFDGLLSILAAKGLRLSEPEYNLVKVLCDGIESDAFDEHREALIPE